MEDNFEGDSWESLWVGVHDTVACDCVEYCNCNLY